MMLEHLGARRPRRTPSSQAIERVLAAGTELTPDMGGKASTQSLGRAIAEAL